jgi:hypothetical protein
MHNQSESGSGRSHGPGEVVLLVSDGALLRLGRLGGNGVVAGDLICLKIVHFLFLGSLSSGFGRVGDRSIFDPEVDTGAEEPVEDDHTDVDTEVDKQEEDLLPGSEVLGRAS